MTPRVFIFAMVLLAGVFAAFLTTALVFLRGAGISP